LILLLLVAVACGSQASPAPDFRAVCTRAHDAIAPTVEQYVHHGAQRPWAYQLAISDHAQHRGLTPATLHKVLEPCAAELAPLKRR